MTLPGHIQKDQIRIDRTIRDKSEALHEIAALAKKNKILKNYTEDQVYNALLDREKLSSTGFENGIAIPHCILENITDFVIGILIVPQGIDFQAMDKKATRIIFFIIAPKHKRNEHISYLSRFSKFLYSSDVRKKLIHAEDNEEVNNLVSSGIAPKEEEFVQLPNYFLFHIILQRHEKFNDILQILSETPGIYLSVIEANNAGNYLYSLPIFASFWNENQKSFNKIIMAVIPQKLANDTLRRLNSILDEMEDKSGILILMHEIAYLNGSINL